MERLVFDLSRNDQELALDFAKSYASLHPVENKHSNNVLTQKLFVFVQHLYENGH